MPASPARLAANRANAQRSTGPRTPGGKAASSRNALVHGARATDATILALDPAPTPATPTLDTSVLGGAAAAGGPAAVAGVVTGGPAAADTPLPRLGEGPGVRGHLARYTAAFAPTTPAEQLYVERCALLAARLDLVQQALDALPTLNARRALADHLREQYDHEHGGAQLRQNPNWTLALRQFDGTLPEDAAPDPRTLPDPELCALAYSLSSPRGAALLTHLAALDRRLQAALAALQRLQRDRRREERAAPIPAPAPAPAPYAQTTPNQSLAEVLIANALQAAGLAVPEPQPADAPAAPVTAPHTQNATNEPNTASQPRPPRRRARAGSAGRLALRPHSYAVGTPRGRRPRVRTRREDALRANSDTLRLERTAVDLEGITV